jgi:hypothetical protein
MRLTAAVNLVRPASASPEQGSLALVLQIGNNPVQRAMT